MNISPATIRYRTDSLNKSVSMVQTSQINRSPLKYSNHQTSDYLNQYHCPVVVNRTSSYFRPIALVNNPHLMKRSHHFGHRSNLYSSTQTRMIRIDASQTNGLQPSSPSLQSTIVISSNHDERDHQKRTIESSSVRLALRCSSSLQEKSSKLFDDIFSKTESSSSIAERLLDTSFQRLKLVGTNSLLIITGHYRDVHTLENALILSTFKRLIELINVDKENQLVLSWTLAQISISKPSDNCLFSSNDSFTSSMNDTCQYITHLYSEHRLNPLLMTFSLRHRSTNQNYSQFHLLSTHDHERSSDRFVDSLMSLALTFNSAYQRTSADCSKPKWNPNVCPSISELLHRFIFNYSDDSFLYIMANVKTGKQLKYWTKIERLLRCSDDLSPTKMSRNRSALYDDYLPLESISSRKNEEIWIDGPLSCSANRQEIWIDGPREFYSTSPRLRKKNVSVKPRSNSSRKHSSKVRSSAIPCKSPLLSSTILDQSNETKKSSNFDTESLISSHCHLPVLPVFKDHSLLPFRASQTSDPASRLSSNDIKLGLISSTNQLNDDMEKLEKTLETLLIPSSSIDPLADNPSTSNDDKSIAKNSLNRIDRLSSMMSDDEKNKRLSRIVSPTRFERLLVHNQSIENNLVDDNSHLSPTSLNGSSVPNSPAIRARHRRSRTPLHSTPNTPRRSLTTSKKCKLNSESQNRPTILQRIFGLRTSASVPPLPPSATSTVSEQSSTLISPLTVTLDSQDDLMPLTTSSAASSASGRASSSGYESLSNTAFDEIVRSTPTPMLVNDEQNLRLRSRSQRKDEKRSNTENTWSSPMLRQKFYGQQRLMQLKHRHNELKLELAMTKTFSLMERNKQNDLYSTQNNPMQTLLTSTFNEEEQLEREIEQLERRLASAKAQLLLVACQKK